MPRASHNTDPAQVEREYRWRWRRCLAEAILMALAARVYTHEVRPGLFFPQSALGIGAGLAEVAVCALFVRDWRCPACSDYLSRAINPNCCPRCGVRFHG